MKKTSSDKNAEKRDFFRIAQDVIFDFKTVEAYSAENNAPEEEFDDTVSLGLLSELRRLDREHAQTLQLLTEKNRLLGNYLKSLSSKIDLIARHTMFAQNQDSPEPQTTRVSLSEDGVAFLADRALYKGAYVAVRLIFLPCYTPVITYAKVLRCDQKNEQYQIAARFHRLPDNDRQEISKQILKTQVNQRKQNKSKP